MDELPKPGDRVTVPFNVGGQPQDAAGTVIDAWKPGAKGQVKIKLDGHGQEVVTYQLDAVEPLVEDAPAD